MGERCEGSADEAGAVMSETDCTQRSVEAADVHQRCRGVRESISCGEADQELVVFIEELLVIATLPNEHVRAEEDRSGANSEVLEPSSPVSYTHLTLPTILLV